MIVEWQSPSLELNPVQVFIALPLLYHRNAFVYRTNQLAKVTAYAFFVLYLVVVVRKSFLHCNGLVRSIFTGDVAKAAVDALRRVDFGDNVVIDVQFFPVGQL